MWVSQNSLPCIRRTAGLDQTVPQKVRHTAYHANWVGALSLSGSTVLFDIVAKKGRPPSPRSSAMLLPNSEPGFPPATHGIDILSVIYEVPWYLLNGSGAVLCMEIAWIIAQGLVLEGPRSMRLI